jgi:hypothetical protein
VVLPGFRMRVLSYVHMPLLAKERGMALASLPLASQKGVYRLVVVVKSGTEFSMPPARIGHLPKVRSVGFNDYGISETSKACYLKVREFQAQREGKQLKCSSEFGTFSGLFLVQREIGTSFFFKSTCSKINH